MTRNAAAILMSLAFAAAAAAQEGDRPVRGAITGAVIASGARFAPREVMWPAGILDRDVGLARAVGGRTITDRSLLVDPKTGGIADCVVWLPDFAVKMREGVAMSVKLQGFAAVPRVQVLLRGAPLRVVNEDGVDHVMELRDERGTALQRLEVPAGGEASLEAVPPSARALVDPRLPFVRAALVDAGHHPAVISDRAGRFKFSGVPPGEVRFRVRHDVLGDAEKTVVVSAESTAEVTLDQHEFRHPIVSRAPFGTRGGVVLRVESVAVGRAELDRLVAFYRARYADFVMPDAVFTEYAIRRAILPTAAAWAWFRAETPRLDAVADEVMKQLAEGHDPSAVPELVPGVEHALVRDRTRRDLDPALGSRVFALEEPGTAGPFLTAHGQHVVVVTDIRGQGSAAARSFHHLFIPYDSSSLEERAELIRRLVRRARVEVLDPALERHVPEENRR